LPALAATEYKLSFDSIPEVPSGKVSMIQGVVGTAGVKFLVEDLSVLQPVQVALLAKDPEQDVRLQLSKFDWNVAERKGSTNGTGRQVFKTRTQGDLKILVTAPKAGTPYQLVVWVGDEVQPEMKSPFVPFKKKGQGSFLAGLGSPVLWVIAVVLIGIFVLLAILVLRGRKS
jgi:hypothetical protein